MNIEHYEILKYIKQCGGEAQLHFLPDHVKAVFSPESTPASIQGTLLELRLWGLIVPYTPTSYKITSKGVHALFIYTSSRDWQNEQGLSIKFIPEKAKSIHRCKLWINNALTAILK